MGELGRNDPCRCGSGKKYKKCCLPQDAAKESKVLRKTFSQPSDPARAKEEARRKAEDLIDSTKGWFRGAMQKIGFGRK